MSTNPNRTFRERLRNIYSRIRQSLHWRGMTNEQVFDRIYLEKRWKSDGDAEIFSGVGSRPQNSAPYEDLIVQYVLDNGIKRIVDVGCGDFQVSGRIMARLPQDVTYTGLDVSKVAVEHNQSKFQNERIKFQHVDASKGAIPEGDLVLVREVLQHIPNADIFVILKKIAAFPHAIATNTVRKNIPPKNFDIPAGPGSRASMGGGLWLDQPPFNCKVEKLLVVSHADKPTEIISLRILNDASKV